jgi:hypothetical protein
VASGKDNLYTASSLAVDINTGKIKWHFQTTPGDSWDFDAVRKGRITRSPGSRLCGTTPITEKEGQVSRMFPNETDAIRFHCQFRLETLADRSVFPSFPISLGR